MAGLRELFEEQLRDTYYAEKQILKALPKMAKKASSKQLKAAFEKHLKETEGQVERLDKVFELIDKAPRGKTCAAIDGILEEGAEIIEEHEPGPALDAAMAAAAQAVEHYEISRYGTLVTWGDELGMSDAVALLRETLDQEEATDSALSKLAMSELNPAALSEDDSGEEKSPMPKKRKSAA